MTSKEKLKDIRYLINEFYSECTEDNQIKSKEVFMQYCDDIEQELTQQPTLSDCIKEWEEKGFKVENNDKRISFENKKENTVIYVDKKIKEVQICVFHYNYAQNISFDLHNLIHKTLKALEVQNNERI